MKTNSIWIIGLIIVLFASCINGIFVQNDVGGLLREGMRLFILTGVAIFIFGIVKAIKK